MIKQLPLEVFLKDDATFDNFYLGANIQVITQLLLSMAGNAESFIYLWGSKGCGKTHLLQGCCHAIRELGKPFSYLSLRDHVHLSPSVLEGFEHLEWVCIDDVEAIAGQALWEEALFHFYNRIQHSQANLLMAGDSSPSHLKIALRDLQSRLTQGLVFQVHSLSDEEKLLALMQRAKIRGLSLSTEVGQFLLQHYSRDMEHLVSLLERLDHASLAAQRKLTIPFVKEILAVDVL